MPLKRIFIAALLLCFMAMPLWAQTGERYFTDYVGKSVTELLAGQGVPQIRADEPPGLTFLYLDKPMLGRPYDVAYSVLGHRVVNVLYNTAPEFEAKASHFNPGRAFTDYMGKSFQELVVLEGPPMVHWFAPDESRERVGYAKINIGGKLYEIEYELADGVVISINYHYEGKLPADKIRPFVRGIDDGLMKNPAELVWIRGDSDEQQPAPEDFWRYLRMISGPRYNVSLVAAADLTDDWLSLDMGFYDRQHQSPIAKLNSGTHELRMVEFSQYVPHSDNIRKLLEIDED